MWVTIDPAAAYEGGEDFAIDVHGPQRQLLEIRKNVVTAVPDWARASVAGLPHVIQCDENGEPLAGGEDEEGS